METLLFGPEDIANSIDMAAVVKAVEQAFKAYANGKAVMPPKSYVELPQHNGDFRAMPAYVEESAGLKWVNVHPNNQEAYGLPTVMGVVIYSDPRNGFPLAVMDGTAVTRYRTGAAAAVATKYLARLDASTLGIIGAGVQAHAQLQAILTVRDLKRVVIHDLSEERMQTFIDKEAGDGLEVVAGTAREAAQCEILSTVTPVRRPVVQREWVAAGTHINAIGADAEGKEELDPQLVANARLVIDDWEQCSHSGEINVPVAQGLVKETDVFADLGTLVSKGKQVWKEDKVSIFDSTGLAIQDIATARLVYETGKARGRGTSMNLVGQ